MAITDSNDGFEKIFNEEQVSAWLGISTPSLQRMRSNGCGPAFVQLSARRIGYRRSAVEEWLAARTINRVGQLDIRRDTDSAPSRSQQPLTTAAGSGRLP